MNNNKKNLGWYVGNILGCVIACCAGATIVALTYKIVLWIL